ncbi:MAG TPA: glycerophosphodiester phosphodiesterase [Gammaproteobacteria bacterium]|nr:glycerophosphodiester phosphodiesterase [Gammaproteobacteria bacterium]
MTARKLVIAHRGASGYLPEHTREAKALAYGQGADFLEQDVVATRDGSLVVLHDIHLDDVTDVARRFPARRRPDGRHYVIDFDLDELRRLNVHERRRRGTDELLYPNRFRDDGLEFRIVTLEEELRMIGELNRATGRTVGIYPEIKEPDWHRRHGIDLSARLLAALDEHGYRSASDPVFVQCFDAGELERCRRELGTRLRLVQLVDGDAAGDAMLSRESLSRIAAYADVVAPSFQQIGVPSGDGGFRAETWIGGLALLGLGLHTWTMRRERVPAGVRDFESMLAFFLTVTDGVFCDQPDIAVAVRDRMLLAGR